MKNRWSISQVFIKTVREEKLKTGLLLSVILIAIALTILPPLVLEKIINVLTGGAYMEKGLVWLYFALLCAGYLSASAREILITAFGQSVMRRLRQQMCEKLTRIESQYFVKKETGAVVSCFVNDVETVDALFSNGIISMVIDVAQVVSIWIVIWVKSPGLGLLLCLIIPGLFVMTRVFQKRMQRAQMANRTALARVNNHVPETIKNIRLIHALSKEEYMEEKYDSFISKSYESMEKSNVYDSIYSPIVIAVREAVISVMMITASLSGAMQSFFGISVGTAVAIISFVTKIFDPIESIGMEIQSIQSAVAGIGRIREFFETDERKEDSERIESEDIELSHVDFAYEEGNRVLENFSARIKQGEKVIMTGRTGAGKSTVFRLLLGLYEPKAGTIWVMGHKASGIADKERRKLIGYVEQSIHLVRGTVLEQISLYDSDISQEQAEAAARMAGIHDIICQLPQGYATPIPEANFSQGQLQLLAMARALVTDPEILLLDEMTANLDAETEQTLFEALKVAGENRTVISISHRMMEQSGYVRTIEIS